MTTRATQVSTVQVHLYTDFLKLTGAIQIQCCSRVILTVGNPLCRRPIVVIPKFFDCEGGQSLLSTYPCVGQGPTVLENVTLMISSST